jgi:predicted nucleic acid-binding protein
MYDQRDVTKRTRAAELFRQCLHAETLVISTQVVQEFYAAATRKLSLEPSKARDLVADLCGLRVMSIQCSHIVRAMNLQRQFGVSFWDALILSAAEAAGASVLYTEDLQDGRKYGGVEVRNPFRSTPS